MDTRQTMRRAFERLMTVVRIDRPGEFQVPYNAATTIRMAKEDLATKISGVPVESMALLTGNEGRVAEDREKVASVLGEVASAVIMVDVPRGSAVTDAVRAEILHLAGRATPDEEHLWLCCGGNQTVFTNTLQRRRPK
jgi:hypothetical protein